MDYLLPDLEFYQYSLREISEARGTANICWKVETSKEGSVIDIVEKESDRSSKVSSEVGKEEKI